MNPTATEQQIKVANEALERLVKRQMQIEQDRKKYEEERQRQRQVELQRIEEDKKVMREILSTDEVAIMEVYYLGLKTETGKGKERKIHYIFEIPGYGDISFIMWAKHNKPRFWQVESTYNFDSLGEALLVARDKTED